MNFVLLVAATLINFAWAKPRPPVDLPPDASVAQMRRILEREGRFQLFDDRTRPQGPIELAIEAGQRNMSWLKLINQGRAVPISFTSKATTGGIPIDQPSSYSPASVAEAMEEFKKAMPEPMFQVLFGRATLLPSLPVEESEYIAWGRKVDRLYQIALRWKTLEPWREYYAQNRRADVRGFYYLNRMSESERERVLSGPGPAEKSDVADWLVSLCLNNFFELQSCREKVSQSDSWKSLYASWREAGEVAFRENFQIQNRRSDLDFSNLELLNVPFRDPLEEKVREFLKVNIEDEWRLGSWALKLIFGPEAEAHIAFEPGVTPHVNALAGNRITMNADQPLSEYDAQWAIRHEFGHVLGFPDCYVEFYDGEKDAMVAYQIDIDNLMCSRHGHLQEKHVIELRRAYARSN